jgi:hypothetical protein
MGLLCVLAFSAGVISAALDSYYMVCLAVRRLWQNPMDHRTLDLRIVVWYIPSW